MRYCTYAWNIRLSVYQFGRIWKLHADDDDDDSGFSKYELERISIFYMDHTMTSSFLYAHCMCTAYALCHPSYRI